MEDKDHSHRPEQTPIDPEKNNETQEREYRKDKRDGKLDDSEEWPEHTNFWYQRNRWNKDKKVPFLYLSEIQTVGDFSVVDGAIKMQYLSLEAKPFFGKYP